jgi:plastocyanin
MESVRPRRVTSAYPALARAVLLLATLAPAPVALTACGDDDEEAAAAAKAAKVDIVDFRFKPATITIEAGGRVTWLNSDVAPHTATAEGAKPFDTGTLRTARSDAVVFADPGDYPYICLFHPFMRGTVKVVDRP